VEVTWDIESVWDISLGGRYEKWKSSNGYYTAGNPAGGVVIEHVPARSDNQCSPKFSLGYKPTDLWTLRYSLAKAYRFPIVEELFNQYAAYNSLSLANPNLQPEDGLHHNLMAEYALDNGYLRVNLYQETIKDVIESQTDLVVDQTNPNNQISVRTFVPVDEVDTTGVEFVANVYGVMVDDLDIRFNVAYTDSEITENDTDTSIVGKQFPRMPEWRSNLLATYHLTDRWDAGINLQYADKSFGRLDNTDTEENVYGAQDGYTRVGFKTNVGLNENAKIGLGIDNITDEISYVAHPWPGRTVYLDFSYDL